MNFKTIYSTFILFLLAILFSSAALSKGTPVFLLYHRFGESSYPSTNITIEQLDAHIKELASSQYTVLPIHEIITKMKAGIEIDDRTVGISVDDAYESIFTIAWPKFRAANLPFTIFISTALINNINNGYLTWDQIREMKKSGVSIGHHTHRHIHMPNSSLELNNREISIASKIFEKELKEIPILFSYPYGEMSLKLAKLIENQGFLAAFGQHSGVLEKANGYFSIPRFALNENFGNFDRFKMIINSLPLQVSQITPLEHLVTSKNPPLIGFTLNQQKPIETGLQCFTSYDGRSKIEMLGTNRVEIRVNKPLPKGRTRLNCTSRNGSGRWRWFGRMFFNPK